MSRRDTQLVHAGRQRTAGAVVGPIFQTANYESAGESSYDDIRYLRLSNSPNHRALAEKLAAITGAEAAVVSASGMAAITATLLSLVSAGDHVLAQKTVYGGSQALFDNDLPRWGIAVSAVDPARPDTWRVRPNTRAFYLESISNPLMEVGDLHAAVAFARKHGLVTVIDNTFCSPENFRPLSIGIDLELHSATKYLNGHSDIVAGVVAGSAARIREIAHLQNHLGGSLDPNSCFLLDRGLKTLGLRVRRQNETALRLAHVLSEHPRVRSVRYPGLPGDPGHERARSLFDGFGGMIAFECEDPEGLIERLQIPLHAPSLGGVETLVSQPARASHLGMPREQRLALGITDDLIRLSVGIEDPDDLVEDFLRALNQSHQ